MDYLILGLICGPALGFLGYFYAQMQRELHRPAGAIWIRPVFVPQDPQPGETAAQPQEQSWPNAA